jgi:hypothetical protein
MSSKPYLLEATSGVCSRLLLHVSKGSARSLLGWSVAKLAAAALVRVSAIDDFEAERGAPVAAIALKIRRAFEPVGVLFLSGDDVRLPARALLEVGGDSTRIQLRQARRSGN